MSSVEANALPVSNATHSREQISALAASTLAFAVNFAVWVMFSVIGIKIKAELNLNETEFGLLVATPILTGSLVRLPLGILTDRYGGRIVYFLQMLAVVIPTWMLSYATEYWQYLVLGLFIGVAGGSFAVGIAYTSAWFSKERQGTAMGIFGAGNAGSSLTKFIAPMIIAASATASWRAVPQVYAVAMLVMAILFWFLTSEDPLHRKDAQRNRRHPKLAEQLLPLLDLRVWRFGLAYYFVFGAFVAMALWLPKYYVGQYGLPLATAAFLTIAFDLPSGAIRALGGWASDKWGGNTVTWWVLWVSLACMFLLSYPPTTMIIHAIKGDVSVDIGVGIVLFTVLIFIVGLAQGFGKASVYRSLADHYPTSMGVVGGIVGVIGGLGGFTLPIMFGVAADVIGVRSSCFMLMTGVIIVTMIWMWVAERNEREGILEQHADARAALAGAELIERTRPRRHVLADWRPDDDAFWAATGRRIANRNLWLSMPPLLLAFAVWIVWSVIVVELPRIGFKFSTNQLFWLAALPGLSGAVFRALYAFAVPIFGGRNFTVWSTTMLLLPTLWIGYAVQDPATNYAVFAAIALLCGLGAGNFSSSMANISFFYPKRLQGTALGLNAGVGNLGVGLAQLIAPIAMYGGALLILGGKAQAVVDQGAAVPIWVQNAGFIWVPLIVLAVLAAWFGMDNIASVRAGFAEQVAIIRQQAPVADELALHRNLRLVHRPRRRLPDARQHPVSGGGRVQVRVHRPDPRRAGASGRRLARRPHGRRDHHRLDLRRDDGGAAGCGVLSAVSERRRQPARLRAGVHGALRRGGHRQRLDVPHDPDHLSHAARAGSERPERPGGVGAGAARRAAPKARRRWDGAPRWQRWEASSSRSPTGSRSRRRAARWARWPSSACST